jgi:RNA polymerase sigma-70 factor (ECF subfamily)
MENTPEERPGPETSAYAGELGNVLEAEIRRLPPGQRIVFVMRHHEGLKLGEIASALGLAEGTVKRQLHAAVHRLRAVLSAANVTVAGGRP